MTVREMFPYIIYCESYFMVNGGARQFVNYSELVRFYGDLTVKSRKFYRRTGIIYIDV